MPFARALVLALLLTDAAPRPTASPSPREGARDARHAKGGVSLMEAATRVEGASTKRADVVVHVRDDASTAISAIDWSPLKLTRRYGVSAIVVRLDTRHTGERTIASACAVSAAVREIETGNLLFVVEGRARVEDSAAKGERAERDAIRAAVEGAIRAVPDGLRRSM